MLIVETCKQETGSNMDSIAYNDCVTYEQIRDDLNNMGIDWDYAWVTTAREVQDSTLMLDKDGNVW